MDDAPRATITCPTTDAEILATWEVMHELRPHLERERYVERERAHRFYFREPLGIERVEFRIAT